MNAKLIACIFVAITSVDLTSKVGAIHAQTLNSSASTSITFLCKVIDKVPTTVARISEKEISASKAESTRPISVIQWKRSEYSESKETPQERCVRVSNILQYFRDKGTLNYISHGEMDGKSTICATSDINALCNLLIFTLAEGENPKQLVDDLRQIINDPTTLSSNNSVQRSEAATRWQKNCKSIPYGLGLCSRGTGGATR